MPAITRHAVDRDWVKKRLPKTAGLVTTYVGAMPNDLSLADMFRGILVDYVGHLSVEQPDSPEICRALRLGAHAIAALFRGATAKEEHIEVSLGEGPPVRVRSGADGSILNVRNWCDGYFMAAISREAKVLDALCAVEPALLRQSSTTSPEYFYLFQEALRSFWRREDEAPERLLAALKATDPETLPAGAADYVLDIVVPQMEQLYRVMLQEADGYNAALGKGLEIFKKYWSKKDRVDNPQGYVALGSTAVASFAFEAEMPIEVESDYVPMWLVRGDCHP